MAFAALYQMGAYHHVRAHKAYPAVRLETGFNHPGLGHIGKMTAKVQAAASSGQARVAAR
jgi:hypothetical protein